MKLVIYSYHAYDVIASRSPSSIGGMELQVVTLARALRDRGHSIEFLVGDTGQRDSEVLEGFRFRKLFLAGEASRVRRIRYFLHQFTSAEGSILLERGASTNSGLLCLLAHHHKMRYVFAVASDVNLIRSSHVARSPWPGGRLMHSYGLRRADAVVLQKEDQRHLLMQNYGRRGVHIPSIALMDPDGEMPPPDSRRVLWVANLSPHKRPELVLDLARTVPEATFVVVGAERNREVAEQFHRHRASIPNIIYLGFLPPGDVEREFRQSALCLNTTVVEGGYEEGFPNTFLQAWAAGLPVVSLISDPDSLLSSGGLGRRSGTIERMASDIKNLLASPSLRREIGSRGRDYVRAHHTLPMVVRSYEQLFLGLETGKEEDDRRGIVKRA